MWNKQRSPVVEEMAAALRSGPVKHDLNRLGISEMSCTYLGKQLTVSWYSHDRPRTVQYDGDRFFASDDDCHYLTRAAVERADRLFAEKVAELERRRAEAQSGFERREEGR